MGIAQTLSRVVFCQDRFLAAGGSGAILTANAVTPFRIFGVRRAGGEFRMSVLTTAGCNYSFEASETLQAPQWSVLLVSEGTGMEMEFSDSHPVAWQRFYRILRR